MFLGLSGRWSVDGFRHSFNSILLKLPSDDTLRQKQLAFYSAAKEKAADEKALLHVYHWQMKLGPIKLREQSFFDRYKELKAQLSK